MGQPHYLSRAARLVASLLAATVPACLLLKMPIWSPPSSPNTALEVERIRAIAYDDGPRSDRCHRRRLDLFLPRGLKDFPVVVLVHGGVWMLGDNCCCGLYSSVGEFLASQGIGAVLPDYRQSPWVKHPAHIKDVARAIAWTHAHIAEYGGRPDQLFLAGHSAGGHLVALLATDETWLQAEGLATTNIKGVIAVSGVYHIPPAPTRYCLGGSSPLAFRLGQVAPLRGDSSPKAAVWPGLLLRVNVFGPAFGDDSQVRAAASPLNHVRPGLPPFLLFSAEQDLPTLAGMAEEFHHALVEKGCESRLVLVEKRNHNSIIFQAIQPTDPVGGAMVAFIRQHCGAP
jgi:acetyl esterase/lipase